MPIYSRFWCRTHPLLVYVEDEISDVIRTKFRRFSRTRSEYPSAEFKNLILLTIQGRASFEASVFIENECLAQSVCSADCGVVYVDTTY